MAAIKGGDDFGPFPIKEQLPGVDFCLTSNPPWHESIILGFQHFIVMLGTTVMIPTILVPLMGGGPRFRETMKAIQGAIMFASIFPVILGVLGLWRIVVRFLSPLAAIPLVTLTALGLLQFGFPQLAKCTAVGLPALVVMVFLTQYFGSLLKPLQVLGRRYGVLATIGLLWAFAAILTAAGAFKNSSPKTQFFCRTDRTGLIGAASWIRFPYPFQWGRPTLNVANGFAMMAATFVSLVESTGAFITAARYSSATPVPPSVVSRAVTWIGIGNFLNGAFGSVCGATASVENAGLLGLNQVGSRRVAQIAAIFMLFFSVLGKFGALLASIPIPIFAAINCVLYAYVVSAGIGFLQFCSLNSFRTKFILGFSLYMGLSIPQYFYEFLLVEGRTPIFTRSMAFNSMVQVIFASAATVGGILALFLDLTLHRSHTATRRDSGRHWWKKFRTFEGDTRSHEFYSLPWGLNRYFPSL
ncbi:hypothetical protein KSS87_004700 [Heliosperma pusillum]|nr:hypothetical protein KSS87_004700 [Heliosperma pusillum]